MRNRQYRRAQASRKLAQVQDWASYYRYGWSSSREDWEVHTRKRAVNPQSCSSYCCGNPRKWFGEFSLQERRVEDHFQDVMADYPALLQRKDT